MADAVAALSRETKAAQSIRAGLATIADDSVALRDTIEGATSLHECIRAVLVSIEDDQALVDGIGTRMSELSDRKKRFEDRIEFKRSLIEQAMAIGELPSIETDIATAFLRSVPPTLTIKEEGEIPSDYFTPQPPKLDRKALLAALKAGPVPGAELSNGGQGLSIRRK